MKVLPQSFGVMLLVFSLAASSCPGQTVTYVRKNASTPAAKDDLVALQTAIGKMKKLDCSDPRSWYYQGAMHWVPNDLKDHSKLGASNSLCASYNGTDAQLKTAWDNCTHKVHSQERHFLVWHRLYIYYLEEIVRDQSGKADFALPYWDYCNPAYRTMPEIFRVPADSSNSLYVAARCTVLNNGMPIDTSLVDLDLTTLMQNTLPSLFTSSIDNSPHGAMHDYIGGQLDEEKFFNPIYNTNDTSGLMSEVASAAFDPIFWVHHSNIDYIWENWLISPNGSKPDLADLEAAPTSYVFFRADGTKVTFTVAEAYAKAFSLPVRYDKMGTESVSPPNESKGRQVAQLVKPHVVKGKQSTLSVKLVVDNAASRAFADDPKKRAVMHVVVSFTEQPHATYSVYVRNSDGKNLDSKEQTAGAMNFFGAAHHAKHATEHVDADHKMTKEFRFDVTNKIDLKSFDGKLDILIKKTGDKKDADDLTIDEINIEAWSAP